LGSRKDALDDLPRYNAAPMQRMPVVAEREGELVLQKMQWWLIPHWSKDGNIKAATFNAKAETLDQSKYFLRTSNQVDVLSLQMLFMNGRKLPYKKR